MATQEVISALTTVVQDCLEDKLQAGFDAQAALTLDIAREVAGAVESKANEYTDIEIEKVMNLITNGEVDLGPFTEFMNSVKELLDGDENTEGYQIFNTLITDTAVNKQTLINHTTSIGLIQNTLNTFQTTLADHEARITALELAQHEPIDCEDCHDELLNIIKGSFTEACTDAAAAQSAYNAATSATVLADWKNELDPLELNGSLLEGANERLLASAVGRRVYSVSVAYPNGFVVAMNEESGDYGIDAPTALIDGDYVFTSKDDTGAVLMTDTVSRATIVANPTIVQTSANFEVPEFNNDPISVGVISGTFNASGVVSVKIGVMNTTFVTASVTHTDSSNGTWSAPAQTYGANPYRVYAYDVNGAVIVQADLSYDEIPDANAGLGEFVVNIRQDTYNGEDALFAYATAGSIGDIVGGFEGTVKVAGTQVGNEYVWVVDAALLAGATSTNFCIDAMDADMAMNTGTCIPYVASDGGTDGGSL